MPKFIVFFDKEAAEGKAKAMERIAPSWASRWWSGAERVLVLESDLTAKEVSQRLFPSEDREHPHIVLRAGPGSYYGWYNPQLWDFLAD